MPAVGPITPRVMLFIQLTICAYFAALFGGYLTWLPNKPMMGGDPFEKFNLSPVNWPIMQLLAAVPVYFAIPTALAAFRASDYDVVMICKIFAFVWLVCGIVLAAEVAFMGVALTEANFVSFAIVPVYFYLGMTEVDEPIKTGMAAIGPMTARVMVKIQMLMCAYYGALFAGGLAWLPNLPFMGGDPFEKFGWEPANWQIAYFLAANVFCMGIYSAVVAYIGSDLVCTLYCQAFAFAWCTHGIIVNLQVTYEGANFTEMNVMSFLVVPVFAYLGFSKATKGAPLL